MKLGIIEGYLPIEKLKLGKDDGTDMAAMKTLLQHMHEAEIPLLCYNFMAGTDWVRTKLDAKERGGALVTTFDLKEATKAMSLSATANQIGNETITAEALWTNLERMLTELLPVAEKYGVTMVMHPDDPPLPEFAGKARIMNSVENFERLMRIVRQQAQRDLFLPGHFRGHGGRYSRHHPSFRFPHSLCSLSRRARQCRGFRGNISRQWADGHGRRHACVS
jgi:mannonate dehydratase